MQTLLVRPSTSCGGWMDIELCCKQSPNVSIGFNAKRCNCGLLLIPTYLSIVYGIALHNLVGLNEEQHFSAEESEIINKTSLADEEEK